MNVVSRIQFPRTTETSCLYIKCNEGASLNFLAEQVEAVLTKNGVLSLNCYFNSFYEKLYAKYTILHNLYYLLNLKGNFIVYIYRELYGQEYKELIYKETYYNCQLEKHTKIMLPDSWQSENAGRIYLEIECLSEHGLFKEGLLITDQEKTREVSLGIITCTFKKEAYIRNTVSTVMKDSFLQEKHFKFFVVDNGKTLSVDEFKDPKVQLIPNKNLGGSGGFARGLVEAIQENIYTHFLFMDDDIGLDSESIHRLFTLYEYAKQDFAVAGGWLDLVKKHILHEAGAFYGQTDNDRGYDLFSVNPLRKDIDLQNPQFLNSLLLEEEFDYGGFWFFSCSKDVVEKIGLLMPFFIQRDDLEFCLRIKKYTNNQIVFFPSISVWHEPPYSVSKQPTWLGYYMLRNNLITCSIHGYLKYTSVFINTLLTLITELLFFNYISASMLVQALEDFFKGPSFLRNNDAEKLHGKILDISKTYANNSNASHSYPLENFYQKPSNNFWHKFISLLTLNGHFIPSFFIQNKETFVVFSPNRSQEWVKPFANKKTIIFKEEKNTFYQYELDQWFGIKLLIRFCRVAFTGLIKWSFIKAEWKNASKELVSLKFWQEYFG